MFARLSFAQIDVLGRGNIALDIDAANVEAIFIGSGGHAAATSEMFIGQNLDIFHANGSKAAGVSAEEIEDFVRSGGTDLSGSEC